MTNPHQDIQRLSNQKFLDFQLPPKLLKGVFEENEENDIELDEDELRMLMREMRKQQEYAVGQQRQQNRNGTNGRQQRIPPNAEEGSQLESIQFWKELLLKTAQDEGEHATDSAKYSDEERDDNEEMSPIERRQQISNSIIKRELQRRQQQEQHAPKPLQQQERRLSSSSSQQNMLDNTDASLSYTLSKYRKEYTELKDKYRSSLDVAFVFSNLLHQQQLYTEQLKKSYANREIEITTLKQNIEALNSALKRSQKVVSADRQKQSQLMDKLMQDYDHVMRSLGEKRELLDIVEQQKNHIVQQGQMIEMLKRELEQKGSQDRADAE
mmetsp:Transcript_3113/g.11933  ORF Transcript_3113/g.11933 Transcript_3113/m.11933 type:complete len:325 (-) Transcript_3113:81-1055(-)